MQETTTDAYPDLLSWRTALDITQDEAAKRLGIKQSRYSQIERGLPMSLSSAKLIAEKTGVPLRVLVGVA